MSSEAGAERGAETGAADCAAEAPFPPPRRKVSLSGAEEEVAVEEDGAFASGMGTLEESAMSKVMGS